ncbi:MAG: kinase [Sphingomonas sp. 28-66-16]|nr:MAG: kinase [Sphingomonas sp. 28-66-16]
MTEPDPNAARLADRDRPWRSAMLAVTALLGAAVLIALMLTLGEATRQRDRALQLQDHSFQVMSLARSLSATTARAEAALGRYVISADRRLGVLYGEQWQLAGAQLDQLGKSAFADRSQQIARIEALRKAYRARGEELGMIALSTRYRKNDQALSRFYQARESQSLTQINTLLDQIIATERSLLAERTSAALRSVKQSTDAATVLIAFGILIALGAILLGWMTVEALGQRAVARAEADAERERAFELERAVTAATAELQQQAEERAATEERLRQVQKMEAVGQLTGGIAHDFNNMLAVVLGGLELAKRNIDDPAGVARHIDNAAEGANRAVALTKRLLAFSRAEPLLPAAIRARDLIEGMSDMLDRTLGDAITVVTADDGHDWRTFVDRHQLENALLNLAVNARDAMEGRGTLTIRTGGCRLDAGQINACAAGEYVTIAVTDTGCGISTDVLDRVFEPFFTTKPVGKGTGLGLSQIFALVKQSQGEITIDSSPRGTTVTLYLPRYEGTDDVASPACDGAETGDAVTSEALTILIVEDDPRVLASTTAAVEALGHRPISCSDPTAAITMLRGDPAIALIISDVLMPGLTGPEMIARLRPMFPDVAVLFVTGYAGEAGDTQAFGGHEVLRKPFTIAALGHAIARATGQHGDETGPLPKLAARFHG